MTLEEKLKSASWTQDDGDCRRDTVLLLSDALSICQEAVNEAKIEEIERLQAYLAKDASNIIHPSTLFLRKQELKEKL